MTERRDESPVDGFIAQSMVERRIFALLENDRIDLAKSEMGQALRRFPDSPILIYVQAHIESREGDFAAAYSSLRQLFLVSPDHSGGQRLLANLKEREGLLDQAFELWDRLSKQYPQDLLVLAEHSLFLIRRGQFNDARVFATRGLEIQPDHVTCLFALSACDLAQGQFELTEASRETLLRVYPDRVEALTVLMVLLGSAGRNREALEIARGLLSEYPGSREMVGYVKHYRMKTHWSMWPLYPFLCLDYKFTRTVWLVFFGAYFTVPFWAGVHTAAIWLGLTAYLALLLFLPAVVKRLM